MYTYLYKHLLPVVQTNIILSRFCIIIMNTATKKTSTGKKNYCHKRNRKFIQVLTLWSTLLFCIAWSFVCLFLNIHVSLGNYRTVPFCIYFTYSNLITTECEMHIYFYTISKTRNFDTHLSIFVFFLSISFYWNWGKILILIILHWNLTVDYVLECHIYGENIFFGRNTIKYFT